MTSGTNELERLRGENVRLLAVLESHGIDARPTLTASVDPVPLEPSRLSTEEKIALFRRRFRGRTDAYPIRWESKAGKSGYSRHVPMSGGRGFATSRASSARIAAIGF
jgi:hypothetical protein